MNEKYLQSLVDRARGIALNHLDQIPRLIINVEDAFKILFPEDKALLNTISNLKFTHVEEFLKAQTFTKSKKTLIAILEAKVDLLHHTVSADEKEKAARIGVLDEQIGENNKVLSDALIKKQHEDLKVAEQKIKTLSDMVNHHSGTIAAMENLNKTRSSFGFKWPKYAGSLTLWGIIVALLGVMLPFTYTLGLDNGRKSDDVEKAQLRDSLFSQKLKIDSLRSGTLATKSR